MLELGSCLAMPSHAWQESLKTLLFPSSLLRFYFSVWEIKYRGHGTHVNLEECFWVWIGNPLGFRVWTSTNSTMVLSQVCGLISSTSLRIHWSTSSEPVSSTESCYGTTESSKVDIFLLVAILGAQHHHERALNVFLLARMQCHDSTKSEIHANWGSSIVQFLI
jgi:hypothetical protein